MKILVTGGAGFIGSHLVDRLLEKGNQVVVIENYATGRRDNLTPHPNLTVVEGTIANEALVHQVFDQFLPDQVVHTAASYKDPSNWKEDSRTNVLGTATIVQEAERLKVVRLIYFQTALCYGLHPLEQPITLKHPIRPEGSSYAISKTAGEQYIALSKLDFVSFRLANVYGPRNLSGPLPTFYQRLINSKPCFVVDTRRDFIYVEDLIKITLMALEGCGKRGFYHVSSGKDYSIKDLFDRTIEAMGIRYEGDVEVQPRNPDDASSILLDPSKTDEDFGWKVKTPLGTGVSRAIAWYKEFGVGQTYTHLKQFKENG